jgi:hypothetical protein
MSKIIENKYKSKDGKIHKRYFITIPLDLILSEKLTKGDILLFNGFTENEIKFIIKK